MHVYKQEPKHITSSDNILPFTILYGIPLLIWFNVTTDIAHKNQSDPEIILCCKKTGRHEQ